MRVSRERRERRESREERAREKRERAERVATQAVFQGLGVQRPLRPKTYRTHKFFKNKSCRGRDLNFITFENFMKVI